MLDTILFIIFIILIIFLIFKFIKSIVHIIISILVLFLFVTSSIVLMAYTDYNNLKEGLSKEQGVILLKDGPDYLTGGMIIFKDFKISPTNLSTIYNIQEYNQKHYSDILGKNYKLFIIDMLLLEKDLPDYVTYETHTVSKRNILNALRSQDPYNEIPNLEKKELNRDPEELKFTLFTTAMAELMESKNSIYLIQAYKKGQIIIYKETMLFKLIKMLPSSYTNKYIRN